MKLIDVDQISDKDIADCLGMEYCSCVPDIRNLLNDQPTAYKKEVVIGQLKECIESSMNGANDIECAYWNRAIERAIEIVKGGGVDVKTES